ncbi:uncharacterized protein LACBIDRAFT_166907, partial [Laccaria bicolor S238N-H82]
SSTTTVSGWIKSIRKQKNVSFAVLTDGSSYKGLQAVFLKGNGSDRLTTGTAVRLTGKLVSSPGAGQSHELLVDEAQDGEVEAYPIQKHALANEYLRDNAHLRARTSHIAAMVRLRDSLARQMNAFFAAQGFCYVHTPILTGNDAEGAGEAFRISPVEGVHPASITPPSSPPPETSLQPPPEFFSRPAYLTVSHQLHLEALATALSRVYTLSPCFRAERSLTSRHLAEFWMLEAEWILGPHTKDQRGLDEVCSFVEASIRNVVLLGEQSMKDDIDVLWKDGNEKKRAAMEKAFSHVNSQAWTRMSYTQAVQELASFDHARASSKFEFKPLWGKPLQSEHERWLADVLVGGPVFVTDYPASLKPFYMRANDTREPGQGEEDTVACFDLLVPGVGELVGGSVREDRADVLKRKMEEAGLGREAYKWYEELRRYGGAPHAGFGMGFERLVGWVGGVDNVRECIPMPRW